MNSSNVVVEEEGASVLLVRLNRPAKRNALTRGMSERLRETFASLRGRGDVRVVILTGAGDAAFCAGTDIEGLAALGETEARAAARRGQEMCEAVEMCGVPVIAAVNGVAAGGGCELALACHLRVAVAGARFTLPETRLGVIPGYGGTQRLARAVGSARALAAMIAGDGLSAAEAQRLGLVNRVVGNHEELLPAAFALAREIETNAPLAVRACLEAVTRGLRLPLTDGLALEAELFGQLFSTADVREGTRAFLEKRPPEFKGK
ncbi:MAG: enoyl-CoA hydratase/isomerase family protein [Pyrinomonadaceae bacterium]